MPKPKHVTEKLVAEIKKLPEGTKERAAKAELAPEMDDAEFREVWLANRIGPAEAKPPKARKQAAKRTAKAPEPRPVPLTNTGEKTAE